MHHVFCLVETKLKVYKYVNMNIYICVFVSHDFRKGNLRKGRKDLKRDGRQRHLTENQKEGTNGEGKGQAREREAGV